MCFPSPCDVGFKKEMMGTAPDAPPAETADKAFKIQMGYVDSAFKLAYAVSFL